MSSAQSWQSAVGFKRVLPPRNLTYTSASPTYIKWTAITNNTPSWSGHAVTSWSITPALPAGLSFSTATGVISGTPTSSIYSALHTVTAANAGGSTTATLTISVTLSPYTWIGTTSNVWSTGTNWFGGAAPSANTHVAIFDNECTQCDANISSAVSARSIEMKNNYTGTITQIAGAGNTINLGTNSHGSRGGFEIDAGTFVGGTADIRADYLTINAGAFTSTSALLTVGYNAASNSPSFGFVLGATATFTHNSGTVLFDAQTSGPGGRRCGQMTLDQPVTFRNLRIDCQDTTSDDSYDSSYIEVAGVSASMTVLNELHFLDGWLLGGTIDFYGLDVDFYCDNVTSPNICSGVIEDNFSGSGDRSAQLFFKGAGAQTYTFQDGASGPTFRIENASGVSPGGGTGTFTISSLNVTTGLFTAPSSTLQFVGRTSIHHQNNSTGITIGASGSFAHNSGTVILGGFSNSYSDNRRFFNISLATSAITFYNLTLNQRSNSSSGPGREIRYTEVPSGTTITVLNNYRAESGRFTKSGGGANPVLNIKGNYHVDCDSLSPHNCVEGDVNINKLFDGTATQITVENPSEIECFNCTYTFNPGAGNTVTLSSGVMNLTSSGANTSHIVLSSGTLHLAAGAGVSLGGNLTNNAAVTCVAGNFIYYEGTLSGTPGGGNNATCYRTTPLDAIPSAIGWADFSSTSTAQTFSGLDHEARIEVTAANTVGTPTKQYRLNGGADSAWTTITTTATFTVMNGHFLEFRVTGTSTHSGTFTIRNLSDSSNILDTVVGTVP